MTNCYSGNLYSMFTGCIYKVTNITNSKSYIGQTVQKVARRWAVHCHPSNNSNSAINKAILKHGKGNFEIEVVTEISKHLKSDLIEELNRLEKYWILTENSMIPNGYNILSGGKNREVPDWMKEKISKALKGRSDRNFWSGKRFSEEHKNRISKSSKWSRKIKCIENDMDFPSIAEAAAYFSVSRSSVSQSLLKERPLRGIWTFKYLEETNV